ncbi:MAG: hypothetical protein IT369_20560 [Candidatus Latescibacteria bacterium]|nr:hypothetical protein [Candidatus Latescibacterota bacterium]
MAMKNKIGLFVFALIALPRVLYAEKDPEVIRGIAEAEYTASDNDNPAEARMVLQANVPFPVCLKGSVPYGHDREESSTAKTIT